MALLGTAISLTGAAAAPRPVRIAFLAAGSQNGFNQSVWDGIQQAAHQNPGVSVRMYDGAFDSTLQYNQVEDVVASGKYDGIILFPNDSVSIAAAIRHAGAAGIKTVAVAFPIGAKLDTLAPQVPGIVATVAANPATGAGIQARNVVDFCRTRNPCNVVLVVGQKVYPFDLLRYRTYMGVLGRYPNIRVTATIEGNYDAGTAMTGMLDVLQIDRHVDAVISTDDVQAIGVEMALKSYGIPPQNVHLVGNGGSQIAVTALRQGRWAATYASLTRTMGEAALKALLSSLRERSGPSIVDADKLSPLPMLWTQRTVREHPDLKAEWQG